MLQELGLARAKRAVGNDYVAAAILDRIMFWAPKAKFERGGHLWVVHTRAEFEEELGGIPEATYYRAMGRLRKAGIIETQTGQHPYRLGRSRATFIRLLDAEEREAICATNSIKVIEPIYSEVCNRSDQSDRTFYIQGIDIAVTVGQPASTGQTKQENQQEEAVKKDGRCKGLAILQSKTVSPSSDDVKGVMAKGPTAQRPKTADTVGQLEQVWRTAHAEAYPDKYKGVAWSMAQKAMGKNLIVKVGDGKVVADALNHVVRNWTYFRDWLKSAKSVKKVPEHPELQYIVGFADRMVDFWQDGAESALPQNSEGEIAVNCNEELEVTYKPKSLAALLAAKGAK